jgi:hypothetical protein
MDMPEGSGVNPTARPSGASSTQTFRDGARSYAAERWATAVLAGVDASTDSKTLAAWAERAARSVSSLATSCRVASASPRRSLELMRLLRALYLTAGRTKELLDVLDITDPRTIRRLFDRAGIPHGKSHSVLMPEAFVVQQRLVTDPKAVAALLRLLPSHRGSTENPPALANDAPTGARRRDDGEDSVLMNVLRFSSETVDPIRGEATIEVRLTPSAILLVCFVDGSFTWSLACDNARDLYAELARVGADFVVRGWRPSGGAPFIA